MPRAEWGGGSVHFWNAGREHEGGARRRVGTGSGRGRVENWEVAVSHLEGHLGRSAFPGHPGRCRAGEGSGRQDQLGNWLLWSTW